MFVKLGYTASKQINSGWSSSIYRSKVLLIFWLYNSVHYFFWFRKNVAQVVSFATLSIEQFAFLHLQSSAFKVQDETSYTVGSGGGHIRDSSAVVEPVETTCFLETLFKWFRQAQPPRMSLVAD